MLKHPSNTRLGALRKPSSAYLYYHRRRLSNNGYDACCDRYCITRYSPTLKCYNFGLLIVKIHHALLSPPTSRDHKEMGLLRARSLSFARVKNSTDLTPSFMTISPIILMTLRYHAGLG